MARTRSPSRDEAKKQWLDSGGKITTKELAAAHGVSEVQIRKWKNLDKWNNELPPKKRGGQPNNKNAAGHGYGAPKGNNNAETHGAYSCVHLEGLNPEEREYIELLTLDTESAMLREYQLLMAKERDLIRKIKMYEEADHAALYVDRVVEMLVPKGKEDKESGKPSGKDSLKTAMQTIIKASPFDRVMKLEAEYNKLHGRILKLIDSIRAQNADVNRLDLDERRHALAKQRLTGEYDIDPATGELNDTESAEDIDEGI